MKKISYLRKQLSLIIFVSATICFGVLPIGGFCGENLLPKHGVWEGYPGVKFEVNSAGDILNFTLAEFLGLSECKITIDKIDVGEEGYFAIRQYIPEKDYWIDPNISEEERKIKKEEAKKAYGYWPRTIMKDGTKMIEILHINGEFNSPSSLSGNYIILSCDGQQSFYKKEIYDAGKTWTAEWKKINTSRK